MAIPSKQIGWSQESNLLWEISKQLDRLIKVVSATGGGPGTTPGIDDVLSQNQLLTTNRSIELSSNKLEINPSTGNSVYLNLDPSSGVTSLEGTDTTVKGTGTITLALNGTGGYINIDGAVTTPTVSSDDGYLEIYVNGQQKFIPLYIP